ncbi:MAG: prepilin-type N-terminal cleavage/methylation domain-containing protein [Akkermansiaceae bacterium]|jgi:prepilin-type N-terminal cleavage/methylation domain-containing protein|nr:prepilin-type N-terminal cleavage/methylation domain-containing protein [Akkermansiaceae bacterium]
MKLHKTHKRGFTLIELLVVIAIIAILAALGMPAILAQLKKAKIAKAKGICTSFEIAVNNFESEYNYLPYSGSAPTADEEMRSDSDIMTVLAGVEEDVNPKRIKFFELGEPKGSSESNYKDGMHITASSAKLYDPWGEPYYMTIDYDYDGEVERPYGGTDSIRKKAICWSKGPDVNESNPRDKDNPSNFD